LPIDVLVEQPPQKKPRKLDSDYTKTHNEYWEKMFRLLDKYKKSNDDSIFVPKLYDASPELGLWVHSQQRLYIKEELSKGRINRLNSIGFVWRLEANSASVLD